MKKVLFILGFAFFASGFANSIEQIKVENSNISDEIFAEMCCRRSASDGQGNVWTVRRCVTNPDAHQAMGAACALAQADANRMKSLSADQATINGQ